MNIAVNSIEEEEKVTPVLTDERHREKINAPTSVAQSWRLKERMKTVSVALVLCLNIPVDPPDIVKTQPCARLEAWTDPFSVAPPKAIEAIANNLQRAYERWQPRARYKNSLDPTVEDVKKLCVSLRRNAKDERVLFHYNGHGVPRPTANGEIWVFNKNYTQYIPLSIYELQTWMGTPSIYVYDCSNAGIILKLFDQFAEQHEEEWRQRGSSGNSSPHQHPYRQYIQLAACGATEILPMNPDLPADVFTACLTTPINMAIHWYLIQKRGTLGPLAKLDIMDRIPGQLSDRRTMLGELNWIFTAITDTIAWNVLPRDLFQKLFRQDLLVASLFRNFLLAQRILRSYDCMPESTPKLPPTHQHPMWEAWDLSLEVCLRQLPVTPKPEDVLNHIHSSFFEEQLTAFQVWLNLGHENREPPEQLPIVLQVLLSQVHRPRALELLGSFLALGPWAVNLVLSVGIFPYVLRLLQSNARELRPLLVFLWAKILAVDPSCKVDLVRENGHKYFLQVLADITMPAEHRTMAAFVLGVIVWDHAEGQKVALQGSLMPLCLEQLSDSHAPLRQWAVVCLGRIWQNHPDARWAATRDNAHEKVYALLSDPVPEVRASAVFSLGTFISSLSPHERTDQARAIDHSIVITLVTAITHDGSPMVRQELVVVLQCLIQLYEAAFLSVARQHFKEELFIVGDMSPQSCHSSTENVTSPSSGTSTLNRIWNRTARTVLSPSSQLSSSPDMWSDTSQLSSPVGVRRTLSVHSLASSTIGCLPVGVSSLSYSGMYCKLWHSLLQLERDPFLGVSSLAHKVVARIRDKAAIGSGRDIAELRIESAPGTPVNRSGFPEVIEPLNSTIDASSPNFLRSSLNGSQVCEEEGTTLTPLISTEFVEWSARAFILPLHGNNPMNLTAAKITDERLDIGTRQRPERHRSLGNEKLDNQIFVHRNSGSPAVLLFDPLAPILCVADKSAISVWDIDLGQKVNRLRNHKGASCISSLAVLNGGSSRHFLATATNSGAVRVWRDVYCHREDGTDAVPLTPSLITAFQATNDVSPNCSGVGLLMNWEQENKTLVMGGDSRTIRLWDLEAERRMQEMPTGGDSSAMITAIHSHPAGPWIVAGFSDGYVRVLDRRQSSNRAVIQTWRESCSWVLSVSLLSAAAKTTKVISGSMNGEVRLWDMRQSGSVPVCSPQQDLTAMATHSNAHLFALGLMSQVIAVHHASGSSVNTIKYHDGFMGQRIAPVSCLTFHPSRLLLAAGTTDSYITVYSTSHR